MHWMAIIQSFEVVEQRVELMVIPMLPFRSERKIIIGLTITWNLYKSIQNTIKCVKASQYPLDTILII